MQFFFGVVVTTGSMWYCMYWCCEQKNKKTELGDALKLTSNNLPQDLIKIKQPRKQRQFFLKTLLKKRLEFAAWLPGYRAKQHRSVVVICCHILFLCHRSAVQPRRKERSSALCAAAKLSLCRPPACQSTGSAAELCLEPSPSAAAKTKNQTKVLLSILQSLT